MDNIKITKTKLPLNYYGVVAGTWTVSAKEAAMLEKAGAAPHCIDFGTSQICQTSYISQGVINDVQAFSKALKTTPSYKFYETLSNYAAANKILNQL